MKNGWTTHSSNRAIWLALSPFHKTMMCKINKLEKLGGQLRIFHTLFGRSAAFYGHFRADTVTSEWSTQYHHHSLHIRYGEMHIRQYHTVTYIGYTLDEDLLRKSIALNVIKKINILKLSSRENTIPASP